MRPGLDELRAAMELKDPYGVPTGAVPRIEGTQFVARDTEAYLLRKTLDRTVDDYLLMARKAQAWDDLRAVAEVERWMKVLEVMNLMVKPPA